MEGNRVLFTDVGTTALEGRVRMFLVALSPSDVVTEAEMRSILGFTGSDAEIAWLEVASNLANFNLLSSAVGVTVESYQSRSPGEIATFMVTPLAEAESPSLTEPAGRFPSNPTMEAN
jgi:hypothetical protein